MIGLNEIFAAESRTCAMEREIKVVAQVVMQCVKSERQVNYQPVSDNCPMYSKRETPLGLYFHQVTRSKKLIDMMSDLNLSINYGKVMEIKKDVAKSIVERREENNGVLYHLFYQLLTTQI